ncbi:type IV toxin-antitoxin system AbiEi family antitoxin domain-containing protein [Mycolicibacterium moriokaense]|uniref:Transcriptional regulator with AbiEi antitoxin domain of type IV toxin-antitoxin system n=1 Tax=Mycolicibacterium moriokaense TaxID=39691 RepID=A0A318HJX5_9MYCO|nr:type IV toxin-antitoxin system AbiEi family antitoxin [Mycolicibacterium moriokaense]PXX10943.1 transcriptional regulator with AbiEi antitoxin domain of type IV toxin-antitoxin system [Mycolicibacterium moriokaense]
MADRRSTPLPAALGGAPLRTVRPKDAGAAYAYPGPELARLAGQGLLLRVANGYYVVVPQDMVGRVWVPDLDAVAAGIASAIYGPDRAVLMGISAARVLGAIPRALATAIVAVPKQHRPIQLNERSSVIRFVKRDTDGLDVERIETPLGPALVTTREQTVLDLAHRPQLGDAGDDVPAAVAALYRRSDIARLEAIAAERRLTASLRRAQSWAGVHRGQG